MKQSIGILLLSLLMALPAQADQLAYISKKQAKKARRAMKKMDGVYLFCGCCSGDERKWVQIDKVEVRFTDYENYYEVVITYTDKAGNNQTIGVDLAYVWTNKGGKTQTIGELLGFEHDPCDRLGAVDWD